MAGNAEKVSAALASGDPEALMALLHKDVEWDYVGAFPETVTYYGPDAVRRIFGEWGGAFDDFGFEAEDVVDGGDHVAVLLHQWGRGKDTGAEVESRTWQVFDFRDGQIVHCRGYSTKDEAFEAAGLDG